MKAIKGQIRLDTIFRTECLLIKDASCNIYNVHDVAVECGIRCEYGCCYSCKEFKNCGAACRNAVNKRWKEEN